MATKTQTAFTLLLPGDTTTDKARVSRITREFTTRRGRRVERYHVLFQTANHGTVNGYVIGSREDLMTALSTRGWNSAKDVVEATLEVSNRGNWYIQLQSLNTVVDTVSDDEAWGSF